MLNTLEVTVAVLSGTASAMPGNFEGLGKDTCNRRPQVATATRRPHALD
jgi:hypothetical protein